VSDIVYAEEPGLSIDDYIAVLGETTMRSKRPLQNPQRIGEMLAGANLIVTARRDGEILGLARCISDGAWVCYCAELAVRESAQGLGIGVAILRKIDEVLGPRIGLALFSEPEAVGFYEKAGLARFSDGFFRTRLDRS
jgi:GNAT superfamily N-acetyltransferase